MFFEGKKILVTGGTGSFGNFIVHRLLMLRPAEIRIISRDEKKQYDMRVFYKNQDNLSFIIGDIRNQETVDEAMQDVDIVLQAAALKQVPNCEYFPMEAIRTNVLGAENVVRSALQHQVQVVVSISTDKAVKPVNVMGMTKALQERIVLIGNQSRQNCGTKLMCVRYGNVLRSRGSVVPFFRRQLRLGEKITITDERMTRFLLTLNDAIDLVLYAAQTGKGGEIYVRKAASAKIVDIAQVLSEEAGKSLQYEVIGKLPGEKIHEILVSEEELERTEDQETYYCIHPWWSKAKFKELNIQYSSQNEVANPEIVRGLIQKSDAEFDRLQITDSEFSKF